MSYNFKLIFTCITFNLNIDLNDTIDTVINKVKNHILSSNNLTFMHDAYEFEIISSYSNISDFPGELRENIISSSNNFINTYNVDSTSFYIRPIYKFNNNLYYLTYNDDYDTKFLIKYTDVLRIRLGEINIQQLTHHIFDEICFQENNSLNRIIDDSNNDSSTSSFEVLELPQCFICYEINDTLQCYYQCTHLSCTECHNRCIINNILSCGICRSN